MGCPALLIPERDSRMASVMFFIAWSCPTTRWVRYCSEFSSFSRSPLCSLPIGIFVFWETTAAISLISIPVFDSNETPFSFVMISRRYSINPAASASNSGLISSIWASTTGFIFLVNCLRSSLTFSGSTVAISEATRVSTSFSIPSIMTPVKSFAVLTTDIVRSIRSIAAEGKLLSFRYRRESLIDSLSTSSGTTKP